MLPESLDAPPIWRPDGWAWPVEFYSDDKFTVPVDLTGYGATWAATGRETDGTPVTITVDASQAATGRLVLSLTHVQTLALTGSRLAFEVQATPTVGEPTTLFRGTIGVDGP